MEDLYKALIGMENADANDIASRLEKYITGSFRGIFDKPSNFDISEQLTIFSVKDVEEALRPVAMYMILEFIWTRVKKTLKKRILVIDEAWYFMKHPDSASFIHGMVKRARKYYLGVTTITQDVDDFLNNEYGKAIVTNASIQFLMKQSTASIPVLAETFYLSEGERQLLVTSDVGEGIFFAGLNHVALRVVASPEEHQIITSNPEEILRMQEFKIEQQALREQRQQTETAARGGLPIHEPSFSPEHAASQDRMSAVTGNESDQSAEYENNQYDDSQNQQVSAESQMESQMDPTQVFKTYSHPAPTRSTSNEPLIPESSFKPPAPDPKKNAFVRYSIDDYTPPGQ